MNGIPTNDPPVRPTSFLPNRDGRSRGAVMPPTSASALEVAHQFWAPAFGEATPEAIGTAAAQRHGRLREGLSRWIGAEGFRALSVRATNSASDNNSHLGILLQGDEVAIAAAVRSYGKAQVSAALGEHLAAVIDLLARIIGEDMAVQLVRQSSTVSLSNMARKKIEGGSIG